MFFKTFWILLALIAFITFAPAVKAEELELNGITVGEVFPDKEDLRNLNIVIGYSKTFSLYLESKTLYITWTNVPGNLYRYYVQAGKLQGSILNGPGFEARFKIRGGRLITEVKRLPVSMYINRLDVGFHNDNPEARLGWARENSLELRGEYEFRKSFFW